MLVDPGQLDSGRRRLLQALGSWCVLELLLGRRLLAASDTPSALGPGLRRLHEQCADLGRGGLEPAEWQAAVEPLLAALPLPELLERVEFERLAGAMVLPELGVETRPLALPRLGAPAGAGWFAKLFGMRQDRAIIPHGHRHMASAHLVLAGQLHLRQYHKLEQGEGWLLIEPSVDQLVGPGSASSISDQSDNVHWLVARGGPAWTLDVIVTGLGGRWWVDNIDPRAAEPVAGGRLRAPILPVREALARYGVEPAA